MSEGKNIYSALHYVSKLHEQISILLQTSDKIMGKNNWECSHGNTCFDNSSASLQGFNKWQPHYLFRFYTNNDTNNLLYVSIILIDVFNEYEKFDEPLITGGYLKSKNNSTKDEVIKNYSYWWSKFYPMSYHNKDGQIFEENYTEWGEEANYYPHLESLKIFGHRLIDITNENDLDKLVISKLLNIYHEESNKEKK